MILSFPTDFDIDDEILSRAVATLMRRYEVRAAVGWEQLFEHPEGSYRLDVEDLAVLRDDFIYRYVGHLVVVSKRRLVLTPCPGVDAQEIALALHEYNATHLTAPRFKALTSFSADRIYDRPTPSVLHNFAGRRRSGSPGEAPEDLVMTMIGAPKAALRDLVNPWLLGCYRVLAANGTGFGEGVFQTHFFEEHGRDTGRLLLTGLPEVQARVFYYEFHDLLWKSTQAGQSLCVVLRNEKFDLELRDYFTRIQAATSPPTINLSAVIQQNGRLTPALLDGELARDLPVNDGPAAV